MTTNRIYLNNDILEIEDVFVGNGCIIFKNRFNRYYGRGLNDFKQLSVDSNQNIVTSTTQLTLQGDFIKMNFNRTTAVGITRDRKIYQWGKEQNSDICYLSREILSGDEWEDAVATVRSIVATNTEGTTYMLGYIN